MKYYTIIIAMLNCLLIFNASIAAQEADHDPSTSPIHVSLHHPNFATMLNEKHDGNRIGYRFHEHEPIQYGSVPSSNESANINPETIDALEKQFKNHDDVFVYEHSVEKDAHWVKQDWTYYMKPVSDGIEILLIVQTYDEGLPEYYGVQQCFRMSGETNAKWRKEIARTPAFSEYDLWNSLPPEADSISLTYVLRNAVWQPIPAGARIYGARTPFGVKIDHLRTSGHPMDKVGPYEAIMLDPIDNGLITRINLAETWVCGIHWQGTSHVTDHHPADCLHSVIDIGNIPPHSRKALQGKIYWFKGDKDDLFEHHQKDQTVLMNH